MFTNLNIFQTAHALAVHSGQRHVVIAQNVANADTPGYSARDVEPFSLTQQGNTGSATMVASRSAHLNGDPTGVAQYVVGERAGESDPNGNSVSVENELMMAVDARRHHDRALAIYKSSLNILRASLGRF